MYREAERTSVIRTDAAIWVRNAYIEPTTNELTFDIQISSYGSPRHHVSRPLSRLRQFDTQWRSECVYTFAVVLVVMSLKKKCVEFRQEKQCIAFVVFVYCMLQASGSAVRAFVS